MKLMFMSSYIEMQTLKHCEQHCVHQMKLQRHTEHSDIWDMHWLTAVSFISAVRLIQIKQKHTEFIIIFNLNFIAISILLVTAQPYLILSLFLALSRFIRFFVSAPSCDMQLVLGLISACSTQGVEVLLSRSGMSEQTGRRLCPGPWLGLCPPRPTGGEANLSPSRARPGPLHWFTLSWAAVYNSLRLTTTKTGGQIKKKQMDEPNKLQLLIAVHMSVSHQTHFPACLVSTTSKWQTV